MIERQLPLDIELGRGAILVSTIVNRDLGWAGICFSDAVIPVEVGEILEVPDGTTDNSLDAFARIITNNVASLDVVIESLIRARVQLLDPSFRPQA